MSGRVTRMNNMNNVAKMLGVEIDEKFEIEGVENVTFTLGWTGLHCEYINNKPINWDWYDSCDDKTLVGILNGRYKIKKVGGENDII